MYSIGIIKTFVQDVEITNKAKGKNINIVATIDAKPRQQSLKGLNSGNLIIYFSLIFPEYTLLAEISQSLDITFPASSQK